MDIWGESRPRVPHHFGTQKDPGLSGRQRNGEWHPNFELALDVFEQRLPKEADVMLLLARAAAPCEGGRQIRAKEACFCRPGASSNRQCDQSPPRDGRTVRFRCRSCIVTHLGKGKTASSDRVSARAAPTSQCAGAAEPTLAMRGRHQIKPRDAEPAGGDDALLLLSAPRGRNMQ